MQILGNWGITVNGGIIAYPVDFSAQAALFINFKAANDAVLPPNPLTPFITQHNINMNADKAATITAQVNHKDFVQATKDAEQSTENRNNLWNPVETHLHEIGDFLKKLYTDNEKKLGEWGFVVDHSTTKDKEAKTKLKLGDKIPIKGIVLGSTLKNLGTTDVHIYKGSTTTGNPIIIQAGESYGIAKGFSTITVCNPSELATAELTTLRKS